jgi:uncharacterized membrane protein
MTLEGSFPTKASEAGIFNTLFVVFMFATWFVLTLAILCIMEVSPFPFILLVLDT